MALYIAAGDSDPELLVDLANVCRDELFDNTGDRARWDRFEQVMRLWNEWAAGFTEPVILAVADDSLRFDFAPDDRQRFERATREGLVRTVPDADRPILDIAERTGCAVLARDRFYAERSDYPWIDGNTQQFVHWYAQESVVHLEVHDMGVVESYDRSKAEEQALLKERRIRLKEGVGASLLEHTYRCDTPSCLQHQFDPAHLRTIAKRGKGENPVCPQCEQPLTVTGSRPQSTIIKVSSLDGSPTRLSIAAGQGLVLGRRHRLPVDLAQLLGPNGVKKVSRDHVEVRFDGRSVYVHDLGSTNGTKIETWDAAMRTHKPGFPLKGDDELELRPRDRVVVAGVLILQRSGRRLPYDLPQPSGQSSSSGDGGATKAVTGHLSSSP